MFYRNITASILEALADTPVILLNGARQTGKSTLVKWLAEKKYPANYLTLDDITVLNAAKNDPTGFIREVNKPVIIDEVQRAPELFLAIKADVDKSREPGQFLLTGSANILFLPNLSKALAGRMEIISLSPLSQGEIKGVKESFVDSIFAKKIEFSVKNKEEKKAVLNRIILGGYPEVVLRKTLARKRAWFESYISTILHRDIRDLSNIEGLTQLPHLLSLLALRAVSLINFSDISRGIGIPQSTLKRYVSLLEGTFLISNLPAWFGNLDKRLTKAPKLIINDSGLMSYLIGFNIDRLEKEALLIGSLVENFIAVELRKIATWSNAKYKFFHFRELSGREVDIVLENEEGKVIGLEIKASTSASASDFKGLKYMVETLGDRFVRGIVLYFGNEIVPFGNNLYAIPINMIWQ
jgi:hypothetical protein